MERLALLAVAVVAATGLASAQGPGPVPDVTGENPWLDRTDLNIAHQGGNHEAPGNTLFAVKNSTLDGPADAFEVDLHRTADGHAVAIHDPTVDRTTNGSGAVSSKTVEELKELDPAFWWAPGNGTDQDASASDYVYRGVAQGKNLSALPSGYQPADFRIPTLREILENVTAAAGDGPTPYMVLEVKATSQHWRPLALHVVDLLHEFNRTEGTIVGSFNDVSTSTAKALDPDVSTSPGLGQAAAWWASTQGPGPGSPLPQHEAVQLPPTYSMGGSPEFTTMSQDIVDDAHANGLAAHVWTINDRSGMHGWLDDGVDGVFTDRPQDLQEVLENRTSSS